jgi:adenylate cyclase, class 2
VERHEIEVKLRMTAPRPRIAARLRSLGATLHRSRHFEDNHLLDDADGRLRRSGSLLRVRLTGRGGMLTYKGPRRIEKGAKARLEIETEIDDAATMLAVLERIGLQRVFRYQKYRTTYRHRKTLIELDETPIGNYIEVEGSPAEILRLSGLLGFGEKDFITKSYYELFRLYATTHHLTSSEMVFGVST